MKLRFFSALCLVLVCFVRTQDITSPGINEAVESLSQVFQLMTDHPGQVIADILYGIILAKGQIRVMLRHIRRKECTTLSSSEERISLYNKLQDLDEQCTRILEISQGHVRLKNDQRFNTLVEKILQPDLWEVDSPVQSGTLPEPADTRNITLSKEEILSLEYYGLPNENISDFCISQVLGVMTKPCSVPLECQLIELGATRSTGYALTHRLLFLQVARQAGCKMVGPPKVLENYVSSFCGQILEESYLIENLNYPTLMADLFCEQVALCGMEGFTEFGKLAWLEKILSWQRPEGCFGNKTEFETISSRSNRRQKREDGAMVYDCLMHFTGVAAAAVAAILRLHVECPQ